MSALKRFNAHIVLSGAMAAGDCALATEETILVTATRTAQIADAALAPVIVITREDIERSAASDVADLLRFHAGMDLGRNGGPGQATSVFLRGTESNHTLVMVDGMKINPGTVGGAAWQHLDPNIIERIEIVKGPRSTLYGSEAIGGVVNIITRRAQSGGQGHVALGAGRYDTYTTRTGVHHGGEIVRAGLDASAYTTNGFPTRVESDLANAHDKFTLNAYLGSQAGPLDWELTHWQASGNTEYLSFFLSPLDLDFTNSATALALKAAPSESWATTLRLGHVVDEMTQNQSSDFSETRRNQIDWQHDFQLDAQQLFSAGLWYSQEDTQASVFGTGFDEDTEVVAVYAQDDISVGDHRVLLAARYTDHDSFGGHTSWDVEYGYRWSERTRFTAAVATAFRAPDATDRFGFGGNPDLDPETSRNIEVGVRHALSTRQSVAVQMFENRIEDLIEFFDPDDFLGPLPGAMENIEEARIRGIELSYAWAAAPLAVRVAGSVQDPANITRDEPLARRAERSLSANLSYEFGAMTLGADFLAQSERKDSPFSTTHNGGYGLVNLTAQWRLQRDWRVNAKLENALDKDYALAQGFTTTDRALFVEVRYAPRR